MKRHATGKGNAGKLEMMAAARARGFRPSDDNEADALAILHWAIETREGLAVSGEAMLLEAARPSNSGGRSTGRRSR